MAIQMIALPILTRSGWVKLTVPSFYPLGAALGGYLFGLAMAWAGGCAAGVGYKTGGGDLGAFIALLGLAIGATAAEEGPLKGVREALQGVMGSEAWKGATVPGLVGAGDWLAYPLALLIALYLIRSRASAPQGAWRWPITGTLMGGLGIVAWAVSTHVGRPFGMAVVPGAVNAVEFTATGATGRVNWDLLFALGIPVGAYLAARGRGPISLEAPSGEETVKAFVGGLSLGVGASLAAGCTVGHSLTGVPLLSVGSLVTTAFILLGSWTVGYLEMRARR